MTYRELKDKLNLLDEALLDKEVSAYDDYLNDRFDIADLVEFEDIPDDIKLDYPEYAGTYFIRLI
jgi:hypothetical protein